MKWVKKGLIFKTENNFEWMRTHAQVPIADKIDEERLRIYFGTRDSQNRTLTTFIEVEANNPQNILYIHDKPILSLGRLGCFDDSGVMPSDIVNYNSKKYFYYLGWNVGSTVRYRVANGLAISEDNGNTFKRVSEGPIMDRSILDPIAVSTQSVLVEKGIWKTWYMSYVKWEIVNGIPEPFYHIKYAESKDEINWDRKGIVCIDFKSNKEAGISRPFVLKEKGVYKMWYSYRTAVNYRSDKSESYKIGYAESIDGIKWIRKDDEVGIDVSEKGWDSEMIAYAYIYEHKGKKYMLYNGNGFGKSGFGYAILDETKKVF
ncbi:MAG: hypothetical protein A7315_02535 [Candidatus Altiarchaeales archaeon WOR_SM1_79]|nr:MAG: hypothetical protein A7315_02535 [Candidatus Altiarchaeales archaeon WOR_SM1_79]